MQPGGDQRGLAEPCRSGDESQLPLQPLIQPLDQTRAGNPICAKQTKSVLNRRTAEGKLDLNWIPDLWWKQMTGREKRAAEGERQVLRLLGSIHQY